MKGIAHFVTGVAIATFFPEVVARMTEGSVLPVLGGVAAILPDTLDFKVLRYFARHDLEIDPGPEPVPGRIARQVAGAMRQAYESGQPQRVMLHTIRLGPDRWRRYSLRFDPAKRAVSVRIGPVVDTGQTPVPGSDLAGALYGDGRREAIEARVEVDLPLVHTYDEEIEIDIFTGPSFTFERRGEQLYVHFLDWHRRWSHSLLFAGLLGVGAAGLLAVGEWLIGGRVSDAALWGGLIAALGVVSHIGEDQLGFMGSNLLFPLTRDRTRGLGLIRSGDAAPNFLTVWTAAMMILFNLDRFSAQPRLRPWWAFLTVAMALPTLVLGGAYHQRRRRRAAPAEALRQADIVSEAERTEMG